MATAGAVDTGAGAGWWVGWVGVHLDTPVWEASARMAEHGVCFIMLLLKHDGALTVRLPALQKCSDHSLRGVFDSRYILELVAVTRTAVMRTPPTPSAGGAACAGARI